MRSSKRLIAGLIFVTVISAAAAEPHPLFVHKKKYVMGTVFEIVAYGESLEQASAAVDHAFREIVRLDEVMSNYKTDSALSRLNHSAAQGPQTVPSDLYRIIREALLYSRLSDGKFDVTVGPLVDAWKAALRGAPAPSPKEEARLRSCVGYRNVELLPPDRIQFHSPCMRIDLGSIGKGYALDRAAAVLRSHGISRALLNAGGSSIYAMGAPPGQPGWLVHLRDPSNRLDPQVTLSDDTVSTSEQTPPSLLSKESAGHIIDPETGVPLTTQFAVSVIAKSATASDALSTTLLLIGPEKGARVVKSEANVAAIWISADGQSKVASSGPQILLRGLDQQATGSLKTESGGPH